MKSKVSNFDLNEIDKDIPMLHGKTEIVLKNVKTGMIDRINSENTFQGTVLSKYLQDLGSFHNSPYGVNEYVNAPAWTELIGGIFLFKNTIQAGNEYMPAGNEMIGNGSYNIMNSGDPTELGSYNDAESTATASAITQVYDYSTAQANGNISCICLTSQTGGYIGYGNSSGTIASSRYYLYRHQANNNNVIVNKWWFGKGEKKYKINYNNSTKILTFTIAKATVSKSSVFTDIERTLTFNLSEYDGKYTDFKKICYIGNGIVRLVFNQTNVGAPNTEIYYLDFNETTETLTEGHWTNVSSITLNITSDSTTYCSNNIVVMIGITGGTGNNGKYAVFDISGNTTTLIREQDAGVHWDAGCYIVPLNDNLIIVPHERVDSYQFRYSIFDIINNTIRKINLDKASPPMYKTDFCYLYGNFSQSWQAFKNPLYLATINNLQTPVEKTAAHTMKVTYTLEEV